MANVEFFKQQAKRLLKDYNTRVYNEDKGFYEYNPRFYHNIDEIIMAFDIDEEDSFTLMNAQHVIARLSGFYKWDELIKASEPILEIGALLLTNRDSYQEKQGIFTTIVGSLIVEDWKSYERTNLIGFDDESKLAVFKEVFLEQSTPKRNKLPVITLDFSEDIDAQDMLSKIMKHKNTTPDKAVLSTITHKNCVTILTTGLASMAVSLWGHGDPDREREELENPKVEIKLSKEKARLLAIVMEAEKVSYTEAILYYMIFTLEALGYHI